ncbi:MAG TPA: DsbC family protein [Burkholderiaceae bacterium]|nr:DsbC family protein [Burkholderiaceae bacterium]
MFFSKQIRNVLAVGLLGGLMALPGLSAAQDKVISTQGNDATGAEVVSTKQVRSKFDERFPGLGVTEVTTTPFPGLFEVRIGTDFLYVDQEVNYVLQGSLIDAKSRRDLTAKRVTEISQVDFSTLPLENAIKQVKGDGSRQMAVFEDPNCGYCKQLHRTLENVDNVTVYTFLFPILSQDSHTRSRNIWCAEDSATAWKQWMVGNKQPAVAECETPLESNLALGRSLLVTGTPAIFFADGSRVNGAVPAEVLEKRLAEAAAAAD